MSWVSLSDAVYAVYHLLMRSDLKGAFNITAPNPVSNQEFTKTLGSVLKRPTILPVPGFAIKAALSEMGQDLLLKGVAAPPPTFSKSALNLHPHLQEHFATSLGLRIPEVL